MQTHPSARLANARLADASDHNAKPDQNPTNALMAEACSSLCSPLEPGTGGIDIAPVGESVALIQRQRCAFMMQLKRGLDRCRLPIARRARTSSAAARSGMPTTRTQGLTRVCNDVVGDGLDHVDDNGCVGGSVNVPHDRHQHGLGDVVDSLMYTSNNRRN